VLEIWASEPPTIQVNYWKHLDAKHLDRGHRPGFIARPCSGRIRPSSCPRLRRFSKRVEEAVARGGIRSGHFLMPALLKAHWPRYFRGLAAAATAPRTLRMAASPKSVASPGMRRLGRSAAEKPMPPIRNLALCLLFTARCSPAEKNYVPPVDWFRHPRNQPRRLSDCWRSSVDRLIIPHATPTAWPDRWPGVPDEFAFRHAALSRNVLDPDPELGLHAMILMAGK